METTEVFPLFRLPLLVRLLIIKFLTLGEQFEFSRLSKKSKSLVKSLDLQVPRLTWELWSGNRNYYKIILPNLQFTVPLERDKTDKRILINDKLYPVCRYIYKNGNDSRIDLGEEGRDSRKHLELIEQLSELVLEIFKPKEFKVKLTGFDDILECFVWKHSKEFKELAINPCCYRSSSYSRSLDSSELKFALRSLKLEHFQQDGPVHYFGYSGTLRMKYLDVAGANWITLDGWKKMKCRNVFIGSDSLSDKKLNEMIKAWVAGEGMKKLKGLHMTVSPDQAPYGGRDRRIHVTVRRRRLEQIVKDIETFPLGPTRNSDSDRQTMEGFDIRRNDGTTAYVAFMTDCLTSFKFRVDEKEGEAEESDSDESVISEYVECYGDDDDEDYEEDEDEDEDEDSEDEEEQEDSDDTEEYAEKEDSEKNYAVVNNGMSETKGSDNSENAGTSNQ